MVESAYQRAESDAQRQRGQQMPQKYQMPVGPNYQEFGEQSGFLYNPFVDEYYIDPKAYQQYQEQAGITKPTPGLLETIAPVAGASLALSAGQTLGSQIPGMLSGLGGGGGASAAGTAGATTTAGTTAAGSAGASGAGTAGTTGAGVGAGLMGLAPVAGALGGAYLTYQGLKDLKEGKTDNSNMGRASRAQTALSTFGFSEIARALGIGGFEESTNVEDKKLQALKDQGILPEDFQIVDEERSRQQQVKDLQKAGQEVPKFLQTGKVEDLTPTDIQGYATLLERNPNDLAARLKDAEDALAAGAVKEGKGSITVDWDKVNEYRANQAPVNKPAMIDPNSPEYQAMTKDQKDEYWRLRNG